MLDRPDAGERCLLLHLTTGRPAQDDEIEEFRALAGSAGAEIVGEITAQVARPNPRYFAGVGKVAEIGQQVQETRADVVLVARELGPSQERNLERELRARVLDRNGLILDIFAQRAATYEGKLQVELAQLEHLSTRLVRGWSHLERQKGGIGLRGPGETQLETDRRLLAQRIRRLRARLERVAVRRDIGRRERTRRGIPAVALVGYTNAGKTTLFNALSGAGLEARDQLFATLDPTVRRLTLNPGEQVLLADTVGFVRDLPHELVAAFRSTLIEAREAALLLHVIDASDPHHEDRMRQVQGVLDDIGASDVPALRVYNKIDRCGPDAGFDRETAGQVRVSARTGAGVAQLIDEIRARVVGRPVPGRVTLGPDQSRLRAQLFEWKAVKSEEIDADGRSTMDVELSTRRWRELRRLQGNGAEID